MLARSLANSRPARYSDAEGSVRRWPKARPTPDLLARPAVCGRPAGMILTRAPSRAPFTPVVKITPGPQTCSYENNCQWAKSLWRFPYAESKCLIYVSLLFAVSGCRCRRCRQPAFCNPSCQGATSRPRFPAHTRLTHSQADRTFKRYWIGLRSLPLRLLLHLNCICSRARAYALAFMESNSILQRSDSGA